MSTYFCLSYNVNVRDDDYGSKIDNLRSKIEGHLSTQDGFSDVDKDIFVDTTITGKIKTSGDTEIARKKNATISITKAFETLIDDCEIPERAIDVFCVVMTGDISQPFSFRAI